MKTPFNLLIVGMTACGKTKYLLEMLKKDYKGVFDFIVLICPTFEWNKTYHRCEFLADEDLIAIPCHQDDVDAVLGHVVDVFKGTNTLNRFRRLCSRAKRKSEVQHLGYVGLFSETLRVKHGRYHATIDLDCKTL